MSCGEDFIFRPLVEGMYKLESMKDGSLSLLDAVKCNEAIDIKNYNTYLQMRKENG